MAARVVAARASVAAARSVVARAPTASVPVRAFASAGDFSTVAGRAFTLRDKKRLNAYVEQAKEFEKFENLLAAAGGAENPQQLAVLVKKNSDLAASARKLVDLENAQTPPDSQLDPYQREYNKLRAQLRDVDGIETPTGFLNYVNSHPEVQATIDRLRTISTAATQGAAQALPSTKAPVRVTVTGASGAIGYSLLFRIASGQMLGPDQPIILQLLELPGAMQTLQGVAMELDDCAFPLLKGIVQTSDAQVGFEGADYALLVGAKPRGKGMERGDLLKDNANIFKAQGQAINAVANKSVKIGVVGNPANTNAMITSYFAPNIAPRQITAMTRLDHTRGLAQLSAKLGCDTVDIERFCIWGNHSATQYPDVSHAQVVRGPKAGAVKAAVNEEWLSKTFIPAVQTRGAAIIAARGASSAASAANAAVEHMRDWALGTNGRWTSMAVCSEGEYGVDKGLWYSYPVVCAGGDYSIVGNVPCDKFSKERMDATRKELLDEKKAVSALLK